MPSPNRTRLTIHVAGQEHERLQMAAHISATSLREFVVQAALEKAERIIAAESSLVLTRRESLRLLALIENPPPRNERFLQAQARYRRLVCAT